MRQSPHDTLLQEHDRRLADLRREVELWARSKNAWWDTWWLTWSRSQGLRRPDCCSQILCSESNLVDEIWDDDRSWSQICEKHGFSFHFYDHITIMFFPLDSEAAAAVKRRAELEWLSLLVTPDIASVYGEVYRYFADDSDAAARLPWRAFEELVTSAFTGQGFNAKLGPGHGDGGIDIRLLDHPVLGDILTVIQVKGGRRPVRLEAVQALAAASLVEGGDRTMAVTASRFLPGAKKWAKAWEHRTARTLTLAGPEDVAQWCAASWERSWFPNNVLRNPLPVGGGRDLGKILVAPDGWRLVTYRFGMIIRQTPGAVLLQSLPTRVIDGDAQRGLRVPDTIIDYAERPLHAHDFFVAIAHPEERRWGGIDGNFYSEWDGCPLYFDTMD